MSEVDANPEVGAEADAQSFDAVAAFSNMLDGANQPQPQSDGEGEEVLDDQSEAESDDTEQEVDEPVFTVKVSGEEIEVPLSELLNGYSRESDYRNKTKELAEMRRTVESHVQQVQQTVATDRQQLQEAAQFFLSQLPQVSPPDPRLIDSQPTEYLRQKELYERVNQQRNTAMAAIQQAKQRETAEQQAQRNSILAKGDEILSQVLPEWRDSAKRAAMSSAIVEYAENFGFSPDEIKATADPRAVVMMKVAVENAAKAAKYDDLMAKTQSSNKRVQNLPPRAERPGRGTTNAQDGRTDAMRALKRSGSADAAAAVFAKML